MNTDTFYLQNIKTHFPADSYYESIFFSASCSQQFIDRFIEELPLGQHVSIAKPSDLGKQKVDVVVDLDIKNSQKMVKSYADTLSPNGLLIVAGRNPRKRKAGNMDEALRSIGMYPLLKEPVGKLSRVNKGEISPVLKLGKAFPNTWLYSPLLLMMYVKDSSLSAKPYVSETSARKRLERANDRIVTYINNHKVSEYIATARLVHKNFKQVFYEVTFINHVRFRRRHLTSIPVSKRDSSKIRVGILMSWIEVGGVERVMLNILKGLDREKFEIHLMTSLPSPQQWHDIFSKHTDAIIHVGNMLDADFPPKYRSKYIAEYIRRNDIGTILITNSNAAYEALPLIAKTGRPTRAYDLLHTHGTPQDQDAFLRISMPYERHIETRIVINEYLKRYYYTHYPVEENRIRVIYNGLDDESLKEALEARGKVEPSQTKNSASKNKTITYIGRLEFDKSPERLVELARLLKEHGHDGVTILIAGEGTLRTGMENLADKYELDETRIKFLGYLANPMELMARSDFTILTSNSEGIPMSVLESMATKTPSIAPAVGGIPEIIDDGIDGFLVSILDKETEEDKLHALYQATATALGLSDDKKAAMNEAALAKIKVRFSSMAREYSDLLEGK